MILIEKSKLLGKYLPPCKAALDYNWFLKIISLEPLFYKSKFSWINIPPSRKIVSLISLLSDVMGTVFLK